MKQRDILIDTADGAVIYGTLTRAKSRKLVIHLHGFTHNRFGYLEILSGEYAAQRGYDHYRFSFYEIGRNGRRLSAVTLQTHIDDLKAVIARFKDDYDAIYISGHSFGGMVTLLTSPPEIQAASFWDPSFDVGHFWEASKTLRYFPETGQYTVDYGRVFLISGTLVEQITRYPHERCLQEAARFPAPAQIIVAERSIFDASPHADPKHYRDAFPDGSEVMNIPDSDHIFSRQGNREHLFAATYDFFDRHAS